MEQRVFVFNPGPAALPLPVLERIRDEILNFRGTGMSILEMSHRSKTFENVLNDAVARVKRLLGLDEHFHVVFLQGGASLQFAMVPMHLALLTELRSFCRMVPATEGNEQRRSSVERLFFTQGRVVFELATRRFAQRRAKRLIFWEEVRACLVLVKHRKTFCDSARKIA